MQAMKAYWKSRKLTMPPMTQEGDVWYFWAYTEDRFIPIKWMLDDFQRKDLSLKDCQRWEIPPTNVRLYAPVEWTEYRGKDVYVAEGIPDTLTLFEVGLKSIGANNNKAVLNPEWQQEFRRFLEVAKPRRVFYVPDNEVPNFWNCEQDNVRYWHETFQKLVPGSLCIDWRQLQRAEFHAYQKWCVGFWKEHARKPQRDEDTFLWQKSDANDLWQLATSQEAFRDVIRECTCTRPLYPNVRFGAKPKRQTWQKTETTPDMERALRPLVERVANAPRQHANNLLFWSACRVAEKGLANSEAKGRLMQAALQRGMTPYEAERTISSAFKRAA